jgi:5-(carboxyamino)imidazole ribonucleotide synthase
MKSNRGLRLGQKLGILGGGQLARMLALEAFTLGLEVHILSLHKNDPAAQVTQNWHRGDPGATKSALSFCRQMDFITFESEFYPMQALIEAGLGRKAPVIFPDPGCMQELADRGSQKGLFDAHDLPTAAWTFVDSLADAENALQLFRGPMVLKKRKGGYDGYGTFFVNSAKDLLKFSRAGVFKSPLIAEEAIRFDREIALVLVRNHQGQILTLPWVETHQHQGRCDWVIGPIFPKSSQKARALVQNLKLLLKDIDYVGTIAFELFEKGTELWINEAAPRVHNSAHYSQNALSESQFLLHLKSGLGMDLSGVRHVGSNFCMVNLIGTGKLKGRMITPAVLDSGALHWYGKTESRAGRKMGHINFCANESQKNLLRTALKIRKACKI